MSYEQRKGIESISIDCSIASNTFLPPGCARNVFIFSIGNCSLLKKSVTCFFQKPGISLGIFFEKITSIPFCVTSHPITSSLFFLSLVLVLYTIDELICSCDCYKVSSLINNITDIQ